MSVTNGVAKRYPLLFTPELTTMKKYSDDFVVLVGLFMCLAIVTPITASIICIIAGRVDIAIYSLLILVNVQLALLILKK
jgi:hypothetical protein